MLPLIFGELETRKLALEHEDLENQTLYTICKEDEIDFVVSSMGTSCQRKNQDVCFDSRALCFPSHSADLELRKDLDGGWQELYPSAKVCSLIHFTNLCVSSPDCGPGTFWALWVRVSFFPWGDECWAGDKHTLFLVPTCKSLQTHTCTPVHFLLFINDSEWNNFSS